MGINWTKAVLGISLLAASTIFADGYAPKRQTYKPQKKCPPPIEAKWGEGNIPCNGYGVYVTADLLVWQAHQDDLAFTIQNSSANSTLLLGSVISPNFGYDAGVRFGIGYTMKYHDTWDTYLQYTHFDTSASNAVSNSSSVFVPLYSNQWEGVFTGTAASSNWNLALNMLDAQLGKQFLISRFFNCRGFFGLRTAWVDQKDSISYSGGTLAVNTLSPDLISITNNFWGMGFLAGLDTLWGLGQGISLYANINSSLICGSFHIYGLETSGGTTYFQVTENFQSMKSITDIALGVRWDITFSKDRYHIGLQTGWEFLYFPNQWQASTAPNSFDLMIQGWVLSARFDF